MPIYEMTLDKKKNILKIIHWYWGCKLSDKDYINHSDYLFLYDLWSNGLQVYNEKVQERLNKIVDIYNKNKRNGKRKSKVDGKVDGDGSYKGISDAFEGLFN